MAPAQRLVRADGGSAMRRSLGDRAIWLSVLMLLTTRDSPAHAQESASHSSDVTSLQQYHDRVLSFRASWFNLKLIRNNKVEQLGFFGGGYQRVFEGSSGAIASMKTYR